MPKIVDHNAVRESIVQNAVTVFASKGYHSTNIIDIAEKTGLSRTTIYQYYKNKDQIFFQVVELIVDLLRRELRTLQEDKELPRIEKMKKTIRKILETFDKNQELAIILIEIRMMFNKENCHLLTKQIMIYLSELHDLFIYNIDKAIKRGEIKHLDSRTAAYMLILLLESYLLDCGLEEKIPIDIFIHNIEIIIDSLIK